MKEVVMTRSFASWHLSTDVFGKIMLPYTWILVPRKSHTFFNMFFITTMVNLLRALPQKIQTFAPKNVQSWHKNIKQQSTFRPYSQHKHRMIHLHMYSKTNNNWFVLYAVKTYCKQYFYINSYIRFWLLVILWELMWVYYLKYPTKVCNYKA